ncbi:protein FAM219B isoform X2 [Zonotrichia albicollis]|uniref:protein FAM219B isoform X2 n=1 Tax=Zonotrichia albicollis TaxID=44394 RepID=UPI003D80FA56
MATGGGGAGPGPGAAPGAAASGAGGRRGPGLIWAEKKRLNKGTDVVEKRGPYIMSKPPSIQAKLKRQRELAKAALRRQGLLGAPTALKPTPKRSVKFNKGYTALSQTADENLVSLDSDSPHFLASSVSFPLSDGEPGSRCSSGYSSAEVTQDLSRQLLQDGYHLDEVPDDEDLDLIPPKPAASSSCPCCFGENLSCVIQ